MRAAGDLSSSFGPGAHVAGVETARWMSFSQWRDVVSARRMVYVKRAYASVFAAVSGRYGVESVERAMGRFHPLRHLRGRAIYLMHVVCGCTSEEIGELVGISDSAVRKVVARVEASRESCADLDRALDELELKLMGESA